MAAVTNDPKLTGPEEKSMTLRFCWSGSTGVSGAKIKVWAGLLPVEASWDEPVLLPFLASRGFPIPWL